MEDASGQGSRELAVQARRARLPLRAGLAYGVLAAAGTYVAVTVFLLVHVVTLGTTVSGVGTNAFVLGTLGDFFGAHLGVTRGVVLGVAGVGVVPPAVYYLVPPLCLLLCGRRCALAAEDDDTEVFLQGATVTVGYLPAVALLLFGLVALVEFGLVGLDPTRALLLAGFVYPVVFGGLGGYSTRLW